MHYTGYKIKKIRMNKGYTQSYMAERLGKSQSEYSRIEKSMNKVNLNTLDAIAQVFEMKPE